MSHKPRQYLPWPDEVLEWTWTVMHLAAQSFNVNPFAIVSRDKPQDVACARRAVSIVLRETIRFHDNCFIIDHQCPGRPISYPELGELLCHHHTTALQLLVGEERARTAANEILNLLSEDHANG